MITKVKATKAVKKAAKKVAVKKPAVKKVKFKPIDENDYGPDLTHFTCLSCKNKFYDIQLYFKDTKSKKCLSCIKFPKDSK
jgi:hypothetical protein